MAVALALPAAAPAHGGPGNAYGNCLLYLSSSRIETYTPSGISVLNRTRRRDSQTVFVRASLWYYGHPHYPNHAYEYGPFRWLPWTSGEWFHTRVTEAPGRRTTSSVWTRTATGQVSSWSTGWAIPMEVSSYIALDVFWKSAGRVVHSHRYALPSLGYITAPYGNRYWGDYCYRWNNGLTLYWHPVSGSARLVARARRATTTPR